VENDTHSFIIRIWHESMNSAGKIVAWRGSIDHVGTGERLHFHELYTIVRFIQARIGATTQSMSWWKTILARIKHKVTWDPKRYPEHRS
jgi:hypothetical protein